MLRRNGGGCNPVYKGNHEGNLHRILIRSGGGRNSPGGIVPMWGTDGRALHLKMRGGLAARLSFQYHFRCIAISVKDHALDARHAWVGARSLKRKLITL